MSVVGTKTKRPSLSEGKNRNDEHEISLKAMESKPEKFFHQLVLKLAVLRMLSPTLYKDDCSKWHHVKISRGASATENFATGRLTRSEQNGAGSEF
jgi:hypothetical protein